MRARRPCRPRRLGRGVTDVDVLAETATFRGRHQQEFGLGASGSEQLVFVAGRQPNVDRRGQASTRRAQKVILRSKHDVAKPARLAGALHGLRRIGVAISNVCVSGRGLRVTRRSPSLGGRAPHAGIQIHGDKRDGKTDIPAIGDAVVREHGGGMRRGFERERRFDEIAFEGRIQRSVPLGGAT